MGLNPLSDYFECVIIFYLMRHEGLEYYMSLFTDAIASDISLETLCIMLSYMDSGSGFP